MLIVGGSVEPAVFINYRGEDSHSYAALLYNELVHHFGEQRVFLDAESTLAGADFETELLSRVRSAPVLLAVIGRRWLTATDPTGGRRIDDPGDWVRRELTEAFTAGVRVIPILTDQAALPHTDELPTDIAALSRCQYRHLRRREPTADLTRIVTDLTRVDPTLTAAARSREDLGNARAENSDEHVPDGHESIRNVLSGSAENSVQVGTARDVTIVLPPLAGKLALVALIVLVVGIGGVMALIPRSGEAQTAAGKPPDTTSAMTPDSGDATPLSINTGVATPFTSPTTTTTEPIIGTTDDFSPHTSCAAVNSAAVDVPVGFLPVPTMEPSLIAECEAHPTETVGAAVDKLQAARLNDSSSCEDATDSVAVGNVYVVDEYLASKIGPGANPDGYWTAFDTECMSHPAETVAHAIAAVTSAQ